jgi:hypothetical protein
VVFKDEFYPKGALHPKTFATHTSKAQGEASGERMHQVQSKLDQRLGAIQDFKRKEVCKSKQETMASFPGVKIKMEEMFEKASQGHSAAHAESRATKHQKKLNGYQS